MTESNWACVWTNAWSYSAANPVWVVGVMTNPPAAAPEVSTNAVNLDIYSGFLIDPALKAVAEWQFQYCTNNLGW